MKVYSNNDSIQELFATKPFDSTLVLEYQLLEAAGQFLWVGVPVDWSLPQGHRKFVKLAFEKVQNFEHLYPNEPENQFLQSRTNFHVTDYPGSYESETAILEGKGKQIYTLVIKLPYLLGQLRFEFQQLCFQQRIGKGKQIGVNKWEYHDTETAEVFSFDEPFGRVNSSN
jgi:hypothetical protein